MTRVVHTSKEILEHSASPRAVVMTMGALHEGHRALMRAARDVAGANGSVVVTIFVNPTQFGQGEDFASYPRTIDADVKACTEEGVDYVLIPSVDEVYGFSESSAPDPTSRERITIDPGPLGDLWEGAMRPGHFRGMLTVVHRLLGMTQPTWALFGEKDYQQLTLIRRMVRDLSLPVTVMGVPTVRDHDGLALSSRNVYLSEEERQRAQVIPRAIMAAAEMTNASAAEIEDVVRRELIPAGVIDYADVVSPDMSGSPSQGEARLIIAVRVGSTRLLDNTSVWVNA